MKQNEQILFSTTIYKKSYAPNKSFLPKCYEYKASQLMMAAQTLFDETSNNICPFNYSHHF